MFVDSEIFPPPEEIYFEDVTNTRVQLSNKILMNFNVSSLSV